MPRLRREPRERFWNRAALDLPAMLSEIPIFANILRSNCLDRFVSLLVVLLRLRTSSLAVARGSTRIVVSSFIGFNLHPREHFSTPIRAVLCHARTGPFCLVVLG